ncbi:MAG: mandelate racemase/muconate lactonizing enzyme family protein [Candidatus Thermoplasmatota archaeon]|jgi:L-alanine-DL-glutamate epimerase-like enolase superfamily enzyme|nr:mandelate racemase/muconate lactonizing enzyme family protein [Candidatus Thermoplasmatota archaeon]
MNSKIKKIEILELGDKGKESSSPWSSTILLVRLTSSDGLVGYGEAPTTFMTLSVKESMKEVARIFQDADFFNIEKNINDFYRNSFYITKSMQDTAALSAFEIASWDLIGKQFGAPVYNLIGGKMREKIRAYANGWYSDCITPDDFVKAAKKAQGMGFTALKFDPFGSNYDQMPLQGLKNAEAIVSALRNEFGDRMDLLIECHGRFSQRAAIDLGTAMEKYGVFFIEEPLHPEFEHVLPELRRHIRVPVALGERLLNKTDFARVISSGSVDVIQPDLTNSLGILEAKKTAAIADSFGVAVAYHNAFGPIQTAATLNVDYSIRNFLIQESFEQFWPDWKKRVVRSGYRFDSGYLLLDGKPGIGAEVDEKLVENQAVDGMEPFDPAEPPWVVSNTFSKAPKFQ